MSNFSRSRKHDQVFISFRGSLRENLVSFLKKELQRSNINFFMDECETRGSPITILFDRIRESGVALIFFSPEYPESCWCLDELVVIKNQMELGHLVPFPVFYKVKADSVKNQTGRFGNTLLSTEDRVRKKVDRGSNNSILETEAKIWEWRQALVSVGRRIGFSYKHSSDEAFLSELVVKVKELLDEIPFPRNDLTVIENPLMHRQEAVNSLLQALNLKKSDLEDLFTKPANHINDDVSLRNDQLVFLDLNSLKNPFLAQRLTGTGQAGKILFVMLGSLKDCNKGFAFKPLLFPKNPQQFTGNKLIVSSQEIQDQRYSVTNCADVIAVAESNDNLRNLPSEDNNSDDSLTCFSFLCNVMKSCAMMISPPSRTVYISFGEKELGKTLLSFLKTGLESNQISVYLEDETNQRIKESKISIVVFSAKYPESQHCLDELVEIKKLMDAREIDPFPIFYGLKAKAVQELTGWFRNRLLKIENDVRKNVNMGNVKSFLDTEARIWGWRQALLSIASKPGLSNQDRSDSAFVSDIITKVKKLLANRDRQKSLIFSNITTDNLVVESPLMHRQETAAITSVVSLNNDLFYSLNSFLQALNLEITDFERFKEIPNGLASLSLKGHNLVFLNFSSLDNLVRFQRSDTFEFLQKGFDLNPSVVRRFEETSLVVALESNKSSILIR